jgi:hypothetical protein
MWTIFAIYFRNTLVNLLILVPVAFAAILLAYGLVWFFARADAAIGWWFTGFLLVAVVGAVYCLARSIVLLNRPRRPADPPPKHWHVLLQSRAGFVALMVAPTVVAAVLTTWLITLAPADAPPTPPAAAAAPAAAAEGTVEVTLDPKRPDKSGVVTVGPVKAVVKVAAPPQAPDPPPRKDKTLKLRYPWYDAVYPLLHWNRPVVDNNIGLVLLAFVTGFSLIGAGAALLWLVAYGFAAAGCLRRMAMLGSLAGAAAAGWAAAPSFAWAAVPPAVVLALWAFASAAGRFRDPVGGGWRNAVLSVSTPVVLAAGAGLLVGVVEELPLTWLAAYPAAVVTVGPPLILVALALAGFVEAAVLSKLLTAHDREWRSRLAATQALIGAAWLAFFGTVFFLPWAVRELSEFVGPKLQYGAVAGWVMTTVGGLFAANSAQSGKGGSRPPSRVLNLLTAVAPVVFLAGLLALLGVLAHDVVTTRLIEAPKPVDPATGQYAPPAPAAHPGPLGEWRVFARGADAAGGTFWWTLGLAGGCVGFAVGLSLLTDVNVFSMHALYGNRLVRGYLGASRRKVHATDEFPDGRLRDRGAAWEWVPGAGGAPTGVNGEVRRENPVTGFDKGDDVTLAALRFTPAKPATAARPATPARLAYRGPYHLIGTALNLRAGGELAVQDRRASSFVLSPGYCGSDETGYAATPEATGTGAPNLTLGRAMTISGAAADANMAVHESPAVTALMTVFNVRLGWWMENPRAAAEAGRTWAAGPPTAGMLSSLAREFLGLTHARGGYVHLSDGGHFDNTGVYELVRRRCRYVVQVDAAADPDDLFEDLAQLVRRVRADFGIRLEIDPTPVRRVGADRLSKWHVAVGRIRYDDVDADALAGTLVYVRASRTGDVPIDVRQYADAHPEFPHTSTLGDQFFDNDQFEAYRMLGEHVAGDVFEDAVQLAPRWPAAKAARASDYRRAVRSLFAEVHGRWYPPPVGIEAAFQQAGQDCAALMRQFREDEHLAGFVRDMYP